jgi:hypothetical protein
MSRLLAVPLAVVLVIVLVAPASASGRPWPVGVFPALKRNLVSYYDFEHPVPGQPAREDDQGTSGTDIDLINGGAQMRVPDSAVPGSRNSLQVKQINPEVKGSDDWKAGLYAADGVPTLKAFNGAKEATIMGWVKMTGENPSPNPGSPNPGARYGAVGLAGLLSGNSDGHAVRALLELINVDGRLHLVALGRRVDGAASQTFAARADWQKLLPRGEWVFLAATFDYDNGTMALYRNGKPLDGFYVDTGDPWAVGGEPEPDLASPTDPRGIKIGGSFPQNTREGNPCDCRMDNLMFLDRVARPWEVELQYRLASKVP